MLIPTVNVTARLELHNLQEAGGILRPTIMGSIVASPENIDIEEYNIPG